MKDEIKEILSFKINADYKKLSIDEIVILENYITNLQEENENLKKDIKFYEYSFNKFKERFEKGTEYIKSTKYCGTKIDKISLEEYLNKLLNILNGGDE